MLERLTIAVLASACVLTSVAPARAHDGIERARHSYDEAEFDVALATLVEVEGEDGLTREELVALLELRAELHLALGDPAAMERDILQRATLDPTRSMPASAPPEMRAADTRARAELTGPVELRARADAVATGVTIDATTTGDQGHLVREIRVTARSGQGAWREAAAPLTLADADAVEYFVEALGPGGAVLVHVGSREAPRTWSGGAGPRDVAGGRSNALWLAIGIGAGVLVVGVAIAVIVLIVAPGGPSDRTQPQLPVIASF